jgi:hypothetical protein
MNSFCKLNKETGYLDLFEYSNLTLAMVVVVVVDKFTYSESQ